MHCLGNSPRITAHRHGIVTTRVQYHHEFVKRTSSGAGYGLRLGQNQSQRFTSFGQGRLPAKLGYPTAFLEAGAFWRSRRHWAHVFRGGKRVMLKLILAQV